MPARVSVVIPSYNTAKYISEALDSVDAQTYRDFETIVVNDGSPDTIELERALEPYANRIKYIRRPHGGASAARNAGIAAARGSLIAFLDSDDIWDPSFLETLLEIFDKKENVDVVYSNTAVFGDKQRSEQTGMDIYPTNEEVTFDGILSQRVWVFCCAVVRAEILARVDGFDPKLRYAEDLDLWLRIAHCGGKFLHTRKALLHYRRRPGSLTTAYQDYDRGTRAMLAVYKNLPQKLALSDSEKIAVALAVKRAKAEITGPKAMIRRLKTLIRAVLAFAFRERFVQALERRRAARSGVR